jgi:CheY-like chemotaxis protein
MKIAIVDDSLSVRMMIVLSLDELNIDADSITEFSTAVEALDDFEDNYYDIIFCDLNMPEMNGLELVTHINNELPHLEKSKIVIVTGEENASYKYEFKELGIHHFIKKPIHPPVFLHHIKPLIEKLKRNV